MKKVIIAFAALLFCAFGLNAQELVDTTKADIFNRLPEELVVKQSPAVRNAMVNHVDRNIKRAAAGYMTQQTYRIRIFFDNGRNARNDSEAAVSRFKALHPGVSVSRTFASPFFKVTVGSYNSKAEAAKALPGIQRDFPTAFIVRDNK